MSNNIYPYIDIPTLEYIFAHKKNIQVEYVYTIVHSRYEYDHISLVDVIVDLAIKEYSIRQIRDEIRIKYKPLTTEQVLLIYEIKFPDKLVEKPHLLQNIHIEYERKKKENFFIKTYAGVINKIKTYPNIIFYLI